MPEPENLNFYEQWKDLINILIGALFAAVSSFVLFILANNHKLRNKLFKEFQVYIEINTKSTSEENVTQINIYYVTNKSVNPEFISYAFWQLPKGYRGRVDPDYTIGEAIFGDQKDYELSLKNKEVSGTIIGQIRLTSEGLLKAINDGELKSLQLIINTSKYGWVKSNAIKMS